MDLLDTNVLSELSRNRPDPGVVAWAGDRTELAISVVTVEEVYFGLSSRPNPRVMGWFKSFLAEHCRVLPVTAEVARVAGELRGAFKARGVARTQADMLIAATARVNQMKLVTRNERDFAGCGITVVNPFK
ncbi:MAG TPA: type II toxin-antitoxin system VapC family toxin [Vicinamibacteria bacterium]|nr:type II toxin-antitoxin system VapC family toxin [Vicinamibacteria bacterium]HRB12366.1 type II toxin-antitoxin system VapC family toxin [Vicinamibacteria bacterium]